MNAKPFYLSKTVVVNVLLAIIALGNMVVSSDFPLQIPAEWMPYVLLGIAVVGLVLRFLTGQPLKVK